MKNEMLLSKLLNMPTKKLVGDTSFHWNSLLPAVASIFTAIQPMIISCYSLVLRHSRSGRYQMQSIPPPISHHSAENCGNGYWFLLFKLGTPGCLQTNTRSCKSLSLLFADYCDLIPENNNNNNNKNPWTVYSSYLLWACSQSSLVNCLTIQSNPKHCGHCFF